jgi:hypothetical protein
VELLLDSIRGIIPIHSATDTIIYLYRYRYITFSVANSWQILTGEMLLDSIRGIIPIHSATDMITYLYRYTVKGCCNA